MGGTARAMRLVRNSGSGLRISTAAPTVPTSAISTAAPAAPVRRSAGARGSAMSTVRSAAIPKSQGRYGRLPGSGGKRSP